MTQMLMAALAAVLAVAQTAPAPAQDDDWEFAEDAAQHLTVAAVRYDSGPGIIAQCRAGALTVVLVGLPASTANLEVEASRADGRIDAQTWAPAAAGAFRSTVPARDARFLHGGGSYAIHTAPGREPALRTSFDLPTQSANLDRVLTACGWPLSDDRDLLARADRTVSLTDPDAPAHRPRRSASRDIAGQGRRIERQAPAAAPGPQPAEQQYSCIIRNRHLADCRPDHPPAADVPVDRRFVSRLQDEEVFAPTGVEAEGRVVFVSSPSPLVIVSREELLAVSPDEL